MQKIRRFNETENSIYTEKVKNLFGERKHTYFIETYGCQMNVRDSQTLAGLFEKMGYEKTEDRFGADAVIFNTCCVREGAEDRLLGNLGKLKQTKLQRPDMLIMICGCMMQEPGTVEKIKKRFRFVDVVFGTHNTHTMPELVYRALTEDIKVFDIWEKEDGITEDMPVVRESDLSAWVNIMYGCNNFCTYCIVPYVRGRERSRKSEDIIREVTSLAKKGIKEITLLGQNVNSYGKENGEISFPDLLRKLNAVEGIERIRFMTSHPKDLSDDLISAMAECDKVCKYLHLPVQSGSNRILKEMNRRYTREDYFALVEKLRKAMPEIALSTDIIVGFPGETDEDFEDTVDLYSKVCFNSSFTFVYSPRIGTPAAEMENKVPAEVSQKRMRRLIDTANECTYRANGIYLNRTFPVLVEGVSKRDGSELSGKTDSGRTVSFKGDESLIGTTVNVKITGIKLNTLCGEREE